MISKSFSITWVILLIYGLSFFLGLCYNYYVFQGAERDTHYWKNGLRFYRHLLNIKLNGQGHRGRSKRDAEQKHQNRERRNQHFVTRQRMKQQTSSNGGTAETSKDNDRNRIFNTDGYLRDAELKVMNFKPFGCKSSIVKGKCWEEVILTHF